MSIPGKVLIALLCAAIVAAGWSAIETDTSIMQVFIPCAVAALLAVILSHRALPMPTAIAGSEQSPSAPARTPKQSGQQQASKQSSSKKSRPKKPAAEKREKPRSNAPAKAEKPSEASQDAVKKGPVESGTVKWFNGTKGFGFIIRESGEEIFVHHRSIVGDGRRSLRDGAPVRFRVAETDKGPQAEDVEPGS